MSISPADSRPISIMAPVPSRFGGDDAHTSLKRAALPDQLALRFGQLVTQKTPNTTRFFRTPEQLDYLASHYLPERFPDGVPLEIWACSTGEEVYSMAILLMDRLNLTPEELAERYPIDASDVDPAMVEMAQAGMGAEVNDDHISPFTEHNRLGVRLADYMTPVSKEDYMDWISKQPPVPKGYVDALRQGYLKQAWQFIPELREGVALFDVKDFTRDLKPFKPGDPPRFIMMRNVLGHYMRKQHDPESQREITEMLFNALPPGSTIVLGAFDFERGVDTRAMRKAGFVPVWDREHHPGAKLVYERP